MNILQLNLRVYYILFQTKVMPNLNACAPEFTLPHSETNVSELEYEVAMARQTIKWLEQRDKINQKQNIVQGKKIENLEKKYKRVKEGLEKECDIHDITKGRVISLLEKEQKLHKELGKLNRIYKESASLSRKKEMQLKDDAKLRDSLYRADFKEFMIKYREASNKLEKALVKSREADNSNLEWIGRTLKLKFIINEMKKVGAIRLPDHEWSIEMVDDIEIPYVPRNIKDKFLPSHNDAHMEDDGGDEEQRIIYSRLTRAAEEHSELLGENPEEKISSATIIQKVFRGMIERRKFKRLYGENPRENVAAAIMIQKIFRGKSGRILSWVTKSVNDIQHHGSTDRVYNLHPSGRQMIPDGDLNEAQLHRIRRSSFNFSRPGRISLTFINTNPDIKHAYYRWINNDSIMSNYNSIPHISQDVFRPMSTFPGHWFRIELYREKPAPPLILGEETIVKYIMIPFNINQKSVYDIYSGVTIPFDTWIRYKERLQTQNQEHPAGFSVGMCNCVRCMGRRRTTVLAHEQRRRTTVLAHEQRAFQTGIIRELDVSPAVTIVRGDEENEEDDINLRLAIQMSIESSVVEQIPVEESVWGGEFGDDLELLFR